MIAHEQHCVFGNVASGEVLLSELGQIAHDEWFKSSNLRSEIELYNDEFVVMLNHIHGIVWVMLSGDRKDEIRKSNQSGVRATGQLPIRQEENGRRGPKPKSLSSFIVGYKGQVTRKINKISRTPGKTIWTHNFHDRVIRNDRELVAIREYIQNNPLKWTLDRNYIE